MIHISIHRKSVGKDETSIHQLWFLYFMCATSVGHFKNLQGFFPVLERDGFVMISSYLSGKYWWDCGRSITSVKRNVYKISDNLVWVDERWDFGGSQPQKPYKILIICAILRGNYDTHPTMPCYIEIMSCTLHCTNHIGKHDLLLIVTSTVFIYDTCLWKYLGLNFKHKTFYHNKVDMLCMRTLCSAPSKL